MQYQNISFFKKEAESFLSIDFPKAKLQMKIIFFHILWGFTFLVLDILNLIINNFIITEFSIWRKIYTSQKTE